MKKILPFLFVLIGLNAGAQIVNIPNANFKNALVNYTPRIDINFDGEIQASEAAIVDTLQLQSKNIADLTGILSFTNLTYLNCSHNPLTTLNVSGLIRLQKLFGNDDILTSINVTGCNALFYMDCSVNPIKTLNFSLSGLANLVELRCEDCFQLTALK